MAVGMEAVSLLALKSNTSSVGAITQDFKGPAMLEPESCSVTSFAMLPRLHGNCPPRAGLPTNTKEARPESPTIELGKVPAKPHDGSCSELM